MTRLELSRSTDGRAIVSDAPGATFGERIGFTKSWHLQRARGWLETSVAMRRAGFRKTAALYLGFAGECRRDAAALIPAKREAGRLNFNQPHGADR